MGIIHGRHVYQIHEDLGIELPLRVEDIRIVELQKKSNGRLVGFAGTDISKPMNTVLEGIEKAIKTYGFKGVNVEPGQAESPIYANNEKLTPIYEKCLELDVPVMFMTGFFCGYLSHNDPEQFERVARRWPKLKLILAHGCYPYVTQAIALAVKCENVFISPDIYMFMPGGSIYWEALNLRPDQFLFGTAYPFGQMKACVEKSLKFPVTETNLRKYMFENAERLLKL
jgi:hypothetical protein